MEEKRNNAVEKVENLTDEKKTTKSKKSAYKPVNDTKTVKNSKNKVENDATNDVKNDDDEALSKRKKASEKRIEYAIKRREEKEKKKAKKAKAHAEKEKAKKLRLAAKKRKQEEYKAEKLRRKEERLARRDMLKHESREEREKRIAAEQQAKINARKEAKAERIKLQEEKASLRRQKLADKRALKEQKRQLKMQNKREKRNRGLGGWLAAVIALGSSTLILATLFTMSMFRVFDTPLAGGDGAIAESYYNLVDYVDNMNVTLSKLTVSNDDSERQKLLVNLSTEASLAAEDIARIPLKDESKYYTTKFINQVADYSKYLNNRLIDGLSLSKSDLNNLNNLYEINTLLKEDLGKLSMDMGAEFDFKTIFNENGDNLFLDKFSELEKRAVDYPKLIYDGPFSDATDKNVVISGKEISTKEAEDIFSSIFSKRDVKNVETAGEVLSKIETYAVKADGESGEIYATISKNGGKLVTFNDYADCAENNYGLEECIAKADEFLATLGYEDMTSVWATESGTTAYINYCYNQGGVIVYDDMIKVTVCKERGVVSAFDGLAYLMNHKTREIGEPKITQKQAITGLSADFSVLAVRLCLIPKGSNHEVLAYEVFGTQNGSKYYIYVDAQTGKETQIFCVVDTLEGSLLI